MSSATPHSHSTISAGAQAATKAHIMTWTRRSVSTAPRAVQNAMMPTHALLVMYLRLLTVREGALRVVSRLISIKTQGIASPVAATASPVSVIGSARGVLHRLLSIAE